MSVISHLSGQAGDTLFVTTEVPNRKATAGQLTRSQCLDSATKGGTRADGIERPRARPRIPRR